MGKECHKPDARITRSISERNHPKSASGPLCHLPHPPPVEPVDGVPPPHPRKNFFCGSCCTSLQLARPYTTSPVANGVETDVVFTAGEPFLNSASKCFPPPPHTQRSAKNKDPKTVPWLISGRQQNNAKLAAGSQRCQMRRRTACVHLSITRLTQRRERGNRQRGTARHRTDQGLKAAR